MTRLFDAVLVRGSEMVSEDGKLTHVIQEWWRGFVMRAVDGTECRDPYPEIKRFCYVGRDVGCNKKAA